MCDKTCIEINTYLGGSKSLETQKIIKAIKSNEKNRTDLQIIPATKWVKHYEQLSQENRDEYKTVPKTNKS